MAEEKQNATPPTPAEQKPKKKLPLKMVIILAAVVGLMEGGTIVIVKMLSKPHVAEGSTEAIVPTKEAPVKEMAEVVLVDQFTVVNYVAGRSRMVITLKVTGKVAADRKGKLEEAVKNRGTEMKDVIRTLVAAAPPDQIKDPKLQVMKRQIKTSMEQIVGEGLIEEILLPDWQPFSSD
jgi:flagellar basal body-associated protein FliL